LVRHRARKRIAQLALKGAAREAEQGDLKEAMETIARAYDDLLSSSLRHRLAAAYIEYYTRDVAARIASRAAEKGWEKIGIVPFRAEGKRHPVDGEAVAGRICRLLGEKSSLAVGLRSLPAKTVGLLERGLYEELASEAVKRLASWGDDVLVSGVVGEHITTFAADLRRKRTYAVGIEENPAAGQEEPLLTPWDEVFGTLKNEVRFHVEVWPEKETYRIGEELRFFLRASRDCFVVVVCLETDGSAYPFMPILEMNRNLVSAGKSYSIPDERGRPFDLPLEGPPGRERIKVIASAKPLDFDMTGVVFQERELVEKLAYILDRRDPGSWTVGECSFEIVQ